MKLEEIKNKLPFALLGISFHLLMSRTLSLCQVYAGMNVEVPLEPFINPFLMKIVLNVLACDTHFAEWASNISMDMWCFFGGKGKVCRLRHGRDSQKLWVFFWVTLLIFHCILLEA